MTAQRSVWPAVTVPKFFSEARLRLCGGGPLLGGPLSLRRPPLSSAALLFGGALRSLVAREPRRYDGRSSSITDRTPLHPLLARWSHAARRLPAPLHRTPRRAPRARSRRGLRRRRLRTHARATHAGPERPLPPKASSCQHPLRTLPARCSHSPAARPHVRRDRALRARRTATPFPRLGRARPRATAARTPSPHAARPLLARSSTAACSLDLAARERDAIRAAERVAACTRDAPLPPPARSRRARGPARSQSMAGPGNHPGVCLPLCRGRRVGEQAWARSALRKC